MCGRFYVPEEGENELILRILESAGERAKKLDAPPIALSQGI